MKNGTSDVYPLVSVVLTTYNREKILWRAMNSVLRQTYKNIELVVVNDYSTDNTEKLLAEYAAKDSRIIVVNRKEPSAVEQKRTGIPTEPANDGLRIASGRYIAHLDDDEMYCPDKIWLSVKIMEEQPQVGLLHGDWLAVGLGEGGKETIGISCGRDVDYEYLLKHGSDFGNFRVMYRKSVYDSVGDWSFDISKGRTKRDGQTGSDYNYWLRVAKKYIIKHAPVIMGIVVFKDHPDYWNPDRDFWAIKEWFCHHRPTNTIHYGGRCFGWDSEEKQ